MIKAPLHYTLPALIFSFAMLPACQKDNPMPPAPTDPCTATKKKTPLEKIWQNDLPNYVANPYVSMYPLVYGDKVVYSGGYGANQKLIVADGKTGGIVLEKSIDFNAALPYFQVQGDQLYYKKFINGAPIRRVSLNDDTPPTDFTAFPGKTADYFRFYGKALLAVQTDNAVILKDTGTGAERTLFANPGPIAPPYLWNLPNGDTILTVLYFSASKYRLESRNITTGANLFSIEPTPRNGIYFEASTFFLHRGMACLASGDYVDCYDVQSGMLRWSYKSPYPPFALGGGSLTAFGHGDYIVVGGKSAGAACLSAQSGAEIWRQPIAVKLLTDSANPTFIDQRLFLVYTPRLQAYHLGAACTDWDFLPPGSSNGFRTGIAYHSGLGTMFVRDDGGHLLAIRYQD